MVRSCWHKVPSFPRSRIREHFGARPCSQFTDTDIIDPTEVSESQNSTRDLLTLTASSRSTDTPAVDRPCHTSADTISDVVQASHVQHMHSPPQIQDDCQTAIAAAPRCSQLGSKTASFWNLNIVEMFNSGIPGDNDPLARQAMLLYHPNEHTQELELITRWLLMHSVKVASLWYDGAWNRFREDVAERKSGIIIVRIVTGLCEHLLMSPGASRLRALLRPSWIW